MIYIAVNIFFEIFKFAHKLWSQLPNTLSDINLLARIYPERMSRFLEKSANVYARGKYATPRTLAEGEIRYLAASSSARV